MKSILLIEDDENLNQGIAFILTKEGYKVMAAHDLAEAENDWQTESFDMVISDISLPDGSGLEFGRKVRKESSVYLVYITALDQEIDILHGYDTGADDYITKPFSVNAMVAKVNALMRRVPERELTAFVSDDIELSVKEMQVRKDNKIVPLSKTELQILLYFMENAERILSKEKILEHVWGIDAEFVDDNTVTVNISRLKTKLGTDAIANVRGLGYIWSKKVTKK